MKHRYLVGIRLLCALFLLVTASGALAQMFHGTFSAMGRFGPVEVVFQQDGAKLKGVLNGNDLSFTLTGEIDPEDPGAAYGTVEVDDGNQFFEAYTDGRHLELYVISALPDGSPDWENVSLLEFDLAAAAEPPTQDGPPAGANNPLAAPPANPLAAPVATDPFVGSWSDGQLQLELETRDEGYGGWLSFQGARYPVEAQASPTGLTGTFDAGGVAYPFTLSASDGNVTLESDGASYRLAPVAPPGGGVPGGTTAQRTAAPGTAPGGSASAGGATSAASATDTSNEILATGPYGRLTRDGALAFIEALTFVHAELGSPQALAGVSEEQIVQALASGYPALDPESQQALANARQIWEQTRQSWAFADLGARQEFAYAVLTIAYGEQTARSALGMGAGSGGGPGGGGAVGMPSADPWVQEQTNNATSCWASAGCESYDPVGDDFTFESPDGY